MKSKKSKVFTTTITALMLSTAMLLTACSTTPSEPSGSQTTPDASNEVTEGNTQNTVLNLASIGESNTLYPVQMIPENYMYSKLIFDTIVSFDDGETTAALAESWDVSTADDGTTTVTFKIRDGVKFHNGENCDAEAVKYNLEHWKTDPRYSPLPAVISWTSIEATANNEVVLTYANPYFGYLTDFSWPDVCVIVAPSEVDKGYDEDDSTIPAPIGTGPYSYGEYESGVKTTFNKFEDYWGTDVSYDTVVVKYIPDSTSRLNALENGEIDLLYGSTAMNYDDFDMVSNMENMQGKVPDDASLFRNLSLNFNGDFADMAVREAFVMAIDKQAISDGIFNGIETPTNTVMTSGCMLEDETKDISDEYAEKYAYNPEKSKMILEEAGYAVNDNGIYEKDGKEIDLHCTLPAGDQSKKNVAVAIQTMLKDININMTIEEMETTEWMMSYYDPTACDFTFLDTYYSYAMPLQWYIPMPLMVQSTTICTLDENFVPTPKEGWEEFFDNINVLKTTGDEQELETAVRELLYDNLNTILDIPLTQQKENIVFNTEKIADYNYTNDLQFFNVLNVVPQQ